jgi:hypothetical protein
MRQKHNYNARVIGPLVARNGVLPRWTYRYPFDHQSQATLGPISTWRGDPREYARCCWMVFSHLVAWVRVGRGIMHVKDYIQ